MCSERRRVQGEMAVFVDLYEWRGSCNKAHPLQGFRPLLLPLLSYARAIRSCTAAGILPRAAQLQPASDRRREANPSKLYPCGCIAFLLFLFLFLPTLFRRLRVYCAPPLSNQQQFRSSSTILKGFGGSSSRDKAPQPPLSTFSALNVDIFLLDRTFNETLYSVSQTFSAVRRFVLQDGPGPNSGFLL